MNIFNIFNRKTVVTVDLDTNVRLTVEPTVGGVNAVLTETGEMFTRNERCYFATLNDLCDSLRLTDDQIVKKLSKAF